MSSPPRRHLWFLVGLLGVALLLALVGYRAFLDLPLIGFDCYPLIAAARVESMGDLWRLVSVELMDGRYTDGHFYRPLTHAAFAFDEALHGLKPWGYHLTDLVILAGCATALAAVALRLFGAAARPAAGIAAAVLLLHPLVSEVVPVAARRADTLALLFTLLLVASTPAGTARLWRWSAFVLAALAVGSKETGALAPVLVFALAWIEAPDQRLRAALRTAAPALAGLALVLGARTLVLGGLGGHGESGLPGAAELGRLAPEYAIRVLYPQPWAGASPGLRYGVLALLALLLLGAVLAARGRGTAAKGMAFLALWTLALLGISLLSGRMHDWYAFAFLAPYGLLLGRLIGGGFKAARAAQAPRAALLLIPSLFLLASHVATSHVLRPYGNLLQAGTLAEETLGRFERTLQSAQLGQAKQFNPWVPVLPPHADQSEVKNLFLYGPYSMQAFADLHTELPVEVSVFAGENVVPAQGRVRIQLIPSVPPSWFRIKGE